MNSWRILHLFLRWQHGEGSVQREQIVVIIDGLVRQMVTMKPLYTRLMCSGQLGGTVMSACFHTIIDCFSLRRPVQFCIYIHMQFERT